MTNRRKIERIVGALEDQGAHVRPSRGGYLIQFPTGGGTTVHFTQSDRRSMLNFRATVERAGLTYPGRKARHR